MRFVDLLGWIGAACLAAACGGLRPMSQPAPQSPAASPAASAAAASASFAAPERGPLAGTAWRLVRLRTADGAERVPADPARYTLAFEAGDSAGGGAVFARLDCNRGRGRWASGAPGELRFGPLALTRALCPPGSLDGELARGWDLVRAYAMRGGRLVLSPAADAGASAEAPTASEWERDPDAGAPRRPARGER